MKAIILAGGAGTRLFPMTKVISKQLLPIYDKPMIYYPVSMPLLAGIREILIISTPRDLPMYKELLGDGSQIGVRFEYAEQAAPRGLAEAFIIGEEFIGSSPVCLVLGDNVFYGQSFSSILRKAVENKVGATVFGYPVKNPSDFGVVEFAGEPGSGVDSSVSVKGRNHQLSGSGGKVISIEEKPANPKSNYAVPGLYFYDNNVVEIAKNVKPSERGELEITAVNNEYLRRGQLNVVVMGRGMAWLDTGTTKGLLKASEFVETVQSRQGFYVSCIEEIAWRRGFIDDAQLAVVGESLKMTEYGQYILSLLK
ncbi:MAG: sugar phosphate nucleotidyltransferase [Oscillospiraceae bacterium]|nr:sugar phosphate nucleotidyltransferase [Oscillospiraceae bacterium]